jgi:hypothetical protein
MSINDKNYHSVERAKLSAFLRDSHSVLKTIFFLTQSIYPDYTFG